MKKIIPVIGLLCAAFGGFHYYFSAPEVSVVMPVYNREDLVARAIDSILTQTFDDFEFIIVDDGSTDSTPKILQDYASMDKRIKIITNQTNRGIAFSRNRGLKAARGKYIAQMDSDDYSLPDRLAKSIHFFKDNPNVHAITGGILSIPEDQSNFNFETPKENEPDDEYNINKSPGFYEVDLYFYNNFFNIPSMYQRKFAADHNIQYRINYKAAEDYDFWMQFIANGASFASLSDALAYIRFHDSNNPTYYSAMKNLSIKLHQESLSRFFEPSEEDLSFEYTTLQKCNILKKMMEANEIKKIMPQRYLESYANTLCPKSDDYIYLIHPFWESFLEKESDGTYKRLNPDVSATIEFTDKSAIVHWEGYPTEEFTKTGDKIYSYQPAGEKIKLVHPLWADTFIQDDRKAIGCRQATGDCAQIDYSQDESVITLHWRDYRPETFVWEADTQTFKLKE